MFAALKEWQLFIYFPVCYFLYFIGDGVCDGYYNTPICDFDGGDCCTSTKNEENSQCYENCQCFTAENYTTPDDIEIWQSNTGEPTCMYKFSLFR